MFYQLFLLPRRRDVLPLLGWLIAYALLAIISLRWLQTPASGPALYVASGVGFAALMLGSIRLWPAIFVGRLAAFALTPGGEAPWVWLIISLGATLAAVAPAMWLSRTEFDPQLGTMRDVGRLTLFGAGGGGLIYALFAAVPALMRGSLALQPMITDALGYAAGLLALSPALLSWARGPSRRLTLLQGGHLALCLAVLTLALWATFLQGDVIVIRVWHLFPLLVWAAIAFNVRGASLALLITSAFAAVSVILGLGPLSKGLDTEMARLFSGVQYIVVSTVTVLLLAAATDERRALRALEAAEARARESEGRLRATHEHAPVGIGEIDTQGRLVLVNEQLCRILRRTREELLGRYLWELMGPEWRERALFDKQVSGPRSVDTWERKLELDGEPVWIELRLSEVDAPDGRPLHGVLVVRDITAEKRWSEQQKLLINELNHRVKNSLATVQSTVRQTLRNAGADPALRDSLEDRLLGLSRAHNVLTRTNWEHANLHDIVREVVAPYCADAHQRLVLAGPAVILDPQPALALAMALQELATNALKYGAWSNAQGRVELGWVLGGSARGRMRLTWREVGGPLVQRPSREGFGSRLLLHGLKRELDCPAELNFHPAGLVCHIELSISPHVAGGGASAAEAPRVA